MSTSDAAEQNLEELLGGLTVDVKLRGLAFGSHATPQAMHVPRLRQSAYKVQSCGNVSHLDDVSCWKGISNAHALELALWERLFQQCLAARIEERLRRSIIVQIKKQRGKRPEMFLVTATIANPISDGVDEFTPWPSVLQSLPRDHIRFVDIDVENLIWHMIYAFYEDHRSEIASRNFRWSLGSEDLPSFVYNFLCTHDCFQDTEAGPCLYVKCTLDWSSYPCLSATAHVAWQPPDVRFHNVPVQITPRGQYIVTPCYVPTLCGPQTACYRHYTGHMVCTVTKSLSMIQWDDKAAVFRARAPDITEVRCPAMHEPDARELLTINDRESLLQPLRL